MQFNIIPVNNEYHLEYADWINNKLKDLGYRVNLDDRDEKLNYRLRETQISKIPITIILGDKERDNNTISYRKHGQTETTTLSVDEFINMLKEEVDNKKLN